MVEATRGFAAEGHHLVRLKLTFRCAAGHECLERERIRLAPPVLRPKQIRRLCSVAADDDFGDQYRVASKGSKDRLVDREVFSRGLLAQVPHAEEAFKACAHTREVGTQDLFAVGKVAEAGAKEASFRLVVVEELRTALVLTDLDVTVVGSGREDAVVPDLVGLVGWCAPGDLDRSYRDWIRSLVAGVVVAGQAVGIGDPLSEVSGSEAFFLLVLSFPEVHFEVLHLSSQCGIAEGKQRVGGNSTGN